MEKGINEYLAAKCAVRVPQEHFNRSLSYDRPRNAAIATRSFGIRFAHLLVCCNNLRAEPRLQEKQMNPKRLRLGTAILSALLLSSYTAISTAQESEVIAGGEIEYDRYCAVCHGIDANGEGIMAKYLTVPPTNLRTIKTISGGTFPFWKIYGVIDGRQEVRAHGTREMPVWGGRFQAAAGGNDTAARAQVMGEILSLVFYLQSLQQ
jgi:mono/diheme cytochrome c family protein